MVRDVIKLVRVDPWDRNLRTEVAYPDTARSTNFYGRMRKIVREASKFKRLCIILRGADLNSIVESYRPES